MLTGRKIRDRFVIERLLAKGSLSSVYLVGDTEIPGRQYVLKEIVDNEHSESEKKIAEFIFLKQIELLKKLIHDGIARVYDGFTESGRFYVLMEYIEGSSLSSLVEDRAEKPIGSIDVTDILAQIAGIALYLESSEEFAKIYRELKPSDFVITSFGRIYLVDAGIGSVFLPAASVAERTRGFAPPELKDSNDWNSKSDVYAIGATAYFVATGVKPGDLQKKLPPANKLNPGISNQVSNLIASCIASADRRLKSPEAIIKKLGHIETKTKNRELQEVEKLEKQRVGALLLKRGIKRTIVGIVILVVLSLFLYFAWFQVSVLLCRKNCEDLSKALTKYSNDHKGRYPAKLEELAPAYIKKIPGCLSGGNYSSSYKSWNIGELHYCRFGCGTNHPNTSFPPGYPCYNSRDGVLNNPPEGASSSDPMETLMDAYYFDSMGRYDKALAKFRDLTMMDETELKQRCGMEKSIIFWNMARIYEKRKHRKEALAKYQDAARYILRQNMVVFTPSTVKVLIYDLKRLGKLNYAMQFYRTLTDKYVLERERPETPTVADMADIYAELGRKQDAVRLYRLFYNKAPDNEKTFISAEIYRLKGYTGSAFNYYKNYVNQPGPKSMYERAAKFIGK
ncbi:MAG: protein kinase [Firmicutes bacterium]|nr:protein kinase [Bacillota bacterium]